MKKSFTLLLIATILLGIFIIPDKSMASTNNVAIKIDGVIVKPTGALPYIKNGVTYVPVRFVSEELGAGVTYKASNNSVTIKKRTKTVFFYIGSKKATINGKSYTLDAPSEYKNGTTMVPLRFVATALDAEVSYNEKYKTVVIKSYNLSNVKNFSKDQLKKMDGVFLNNEQVKALYKMIDTYEDTKQWLGYIPGAGPLFTDGLEFLLEIFKGYDIDVSRFEMKLIKADNGRGVIMYKDTGKIISQ